MDDAATLALIEKTASTAAGRAVRDILLELGVDASAPIEVQKDMAALRELRVLVSDPEFQKDMLRLRRWRKTMDNVQTRGVATLVGLVVVALCAAVVIGLQDFFGGVSN